MINREKNFMRYIVLFRGINVSGKNKISMNDLKIMLDNNNYKNVITYLNSGNVILESNYDIDYITNDINSLIKKSFNLDIPVFVISYEELNDILKHIPNWWGTDNKEIYDNIIFIMKPITYKEVFDNVGEPSINIDKVEVWSFDLGNYKKSNWWKRTASTSIKDYITIRTANTIRKVLELCNK